MSEDRPPGEDPFRDLDPEAAERKRRRAEREARRRARAERDRSESHRRSLGGRVGGLRREASEPPPERPAAGPSQAGAPAEEPRSGPDPAPMPGAAAESVGSRSRLDPIMTRRLTAAGAVLAAIVLIVAVVKLASGGDEQVAVAEPEPLKTVNVTIPEGLTIGQTADLAKQAKLKGSYEKAAAKAIKGFPLRRYGAKGADSLEGFMFPATYELEKNAPAAELVDKQLTAFEDNFAGVDMKRAASKNLTPYDVVKVASMIEKEVQVAKERPLVAAVIYNRLAAGDTLGIDATLRYELNNYDRQLRQSELDAPTPYNTRIVAGLPPTPIGNPGLAALEAAAAPARSDVYYFVIKPGTCGKHVFTADSSEFEAAQAAYQEALAAEGGSPTDCPG
jgi:UPF0755 protein